jgi:hypothetical protein
MTQGLRERLTATRKVAEAIRAALPGGNPARREVTPTPTERRARRPREPGDLPVAAPVAAPKGTAAPAPPVTVEYLRFLHAQAAALRVDLPELQNLTTSISRLEEFLVRTVLPLHFSVLNQQSR